MKIINYIYNLYLDLFYFEDGEINNSEVQWHEFGDK